MRAIADPFVVAAPSGARVRTRLRVSAEDEAVLRTVGQHLASLAGADLAARCAAGNGGAGGRVSKHAGRADRKQALTAASSSRWAGTITRISADQWQRALDNLYDQRAGLRAAIGVITARLAVPVATKAGGIRGYATRAERWQKQRRRQHLQARLARVERRIAAGRVSVVRGGVRLARARHHLGAAGVTEAEWRVRWEAARRFVTADGEADKAWGNETIRVHPEHGWVQVRLPGPLAQLSNTPGPAPTYRLSCRVAFAHRGDAWAAQAASGAVAYTIWFCADKGRWYLDAAWTAPKPDQPCLEELRGHRTLAVDLNADHLACWVLDASGNPVGDAHRVDVALTGSATRRDGRLRQALSELLRLARDNHCRSVTVENLDFADARATGRETLGRGRRGRRFRRTVAGIPTAKFRDRLLGMAHNRGLAVIAVDPAYTSRWGAQHWQQPLASSHTKTSGRAVTRHQAAAVVIGRRALGHRARRRTEKTAPHLRMRSGEPSSRPDMTAQPVRNPGTRKGGPHQQTLDKTAPCDRDPPGDQATQHRSGTPTGQDTLLLSD